MDEGSPFKVSCYSNADRWRWTRFSKQYICSQNF